MGGGASSIPAYIDKEAFRHFSGGTINDAIFDANSEGGVMKRERLIELSQKRDCYMSYADGADALGRSNPDRVLRINQALTGRGLLTYMVDKKAMGDVVKDVSGGIDKSRCMAVFVTKDYLDRIAKNLPTDPNCIEFNYNLRRKHPDNCVPVIMEPGLMDPSQLHGLVGQVLGERFFVDFTDDNNFEAKIDLLYAEIIKLSKAPEKFFAPELLVSNSILSQVNKPREEQQFFQWMARSTSIEEGRRIIYCTSLVRAGVSSVFVLARMMKADTQCLAHLGFSDPDADQVFQAVRDLGLGNVPLPDFSNSSTMESVVFAMQKASQAAEDPKMAELALACVARCAASNRVMPQLLANAGMCDNVLRLMMRNLSHPVCMEAGSLAIYTMVANNLEVAGQFGLIGGADVLPRTIRSHFTNEKVVFHGCHSIAQMSLVKDNRLVFSNTGACDCVVQSMLRNVQNAEVVEKAALAGNRLGFNHLENVGKLGLAGACQAIAQGLAAHPQHAGVVLQLFRLSIMIAVEPNNRAQLATPLCCRAIVVALQQQLEQPEVILEGCKAVCNIVLGIAHNRTQFGQAGMCETIKAVVGRYHQHPQVAGPACAATFAMAAGSHEHKQRFDGMQVLVQSILNNPQMPPEARKEAKEALLRI